MTDATVSTLLNRLAPLIEEKVRDEVCMLLHAQNDAENLSSKLKKIHEVLADAEQKRVMDPMVENWLNELQHIAYEIDDVLDEWEMENIRQQQFEESEEDPWHKVSSFLESVCLCFNHTVQHRRIAINVREINQRLDSIADESANELKFIPNLVLDCQNFERIESTSFVEVSEIQGRDPDKNALLKMMLSLESESCSRGIETVSIVGAGGMGKTALAQLVFNDAIVKRHFQHIQRFISGVKFLLVLDDVWTEEETVLEPLKVSLKNGAPGSRVLVTTRKNKVAQAMGGEIHTLKPLSGSYSWSLLSQIAFHGKSDRDCDLLQETGLKIAEKCKGLPLAAKAMGGLLRHKTSLQEWEDVLNSELNPKQEKMETDVFPILALSYNELHPTVKRCFTYCAVFPKDTTIHVEELIRIWMAQGFLSLSGTNESQMELRGREYFDDLPMRSLFEDFEKDQDSNRIIRCKMHDIIHDFAQFLSKNECLIVERIDGRSQSQVCQKARHLNMLQDRNENPLLPYEICEPENLRSFFCRTTTISWNLTTHLKRVRLLSLQNCRLLSIPDEIHRLIHLRYLNISGNPIKQLPQTIYDLYNLQTLDLQGCGDLFQLPAGIHKLRNLRHLLNNGAAVKLEFPLGFEKLTNLRTLNKLCVTRGCNQLGYLKELNQLEGHLELLVVDLNEMGATKPELTRKKFLQELTLNCGLSGPEIIEALQPSPMLQVLFFGGIQLPLWVTTITYLRRLTFVGIRGSNNSSPLQPLGELHFLEVLDLFNLEMERLGCEFLGKNRIAFRSLRSLRFRNCVMWNEWEDISEEQENSGIAILPCLEKLQLCISPELKALPHRLLGKASSLKNLVIFYCTYLEKRYDRLTGEDWDKISHIPDVVIQ